MQTAANPTRSPWAHLRIPPFPRIAIQVLQLTTKTEVSMRQVSDLIATDSAFSSEVLTIVNSALYARRTPVTSILQAIALLGTDNLRGVCLTVGVRTYLGKSLNQESLRAIWRHSLATALIAQQLGAVTSLDKDAAYTAGVLHDIGRLALAVIRPQAYADLLMHHVGSPASILAGETELFGFDHCEAGRRLLADWNLPRQFETIVSDHHSELAHPQPNRLEDLVRQSCRLADTSGFAVFPGCERLPLEDLLSVFPEHERKALWPDMPTLTFEISARINSLEMTT